MVPALTERWKGMKNVKREEARKLAAELVAQMTLEEKCSQLRYDAPAIERLGIPAYNWWNEGIHGVARAGTATLFPQAIGLAASFDPELLREIGEVTATEARAKYNAQAAHGDRDIYKGLTFWAPNVNIFRDPRWGRGHETYGEDPYLTSRLGVSFVEGMQGEGETLKVAACAKHFAVHSGPEALRHEFDVRVNPKDMNETYLPAFKALVKEAGVEAVMGAYNRVNGEVCCGSRTLLQETLREKWGFEGHVVSDCWAIRDFHERHCVTATAEESAALALENGCDINCGNTYLYVLKACRDGLVSEEQITAAAVRALTTRYLLGIMPGQSSEYDAIPYREVGSAAHRALARRAAAESAVLLRNEGLLPLDITKLHAIGIIGPNADSRDSLTGNYHGTAGRYVTVSEGVQEYVERENARRGEKDSIRVFYSVGCDVREDRVEALAAAEDRLAEARIVAEHSDVVLLCVGLNEFLEGEETDTGNYVGSGDKEDLYLPAPQRKLMEAVAETGRPVVCLLMAGSDIDLSYAEGHFDAILDLWYPGEQGGAAAADLLFGAASPCGKLPVTFYRDLALLPDFTDYSMQGRTYRYLRGEAQFPFGYGLNYGRTRVRAASCRVGDAGEPDGVPAKRLIISAELLNEGAMDTREVAEVYVKPLDAPDAAELHWALCGIRKLTVPAGGSASCEIVVSPESLRTVNAAGEAVAEGRRFRLYVGTSQPDERSARLTGARPVELEVEL